MGEALAATAPATYEQLVDFPVSLNSSRSEKLYASSPESIVGWGSFQIVRQRQSWRKLSTAICPVCCKDYWEWKT